MSRDAARARSISSARKGWWAGAAIGLAGAGAGPGGAAAAFLAVIAVIAGIALRLFHLAGQVLGGDELHAVRAALAQPLGALLATYQLADSCIPLTALDRLLLDHGIALDEWILRLPVLACGLAALVLLPALACRRLPPPALPLFAGLVAISPLLVLYSRIARSYMPATLLAFAAVMAFDAWWRPSRDTSYGDSPRRRTGAAAAYVVLAALAVWFHLGAAPIVAAPLLYALIDLALSRRGRRSLPASPAAPAALPALASAPLPAGPAPAATATPTRSTNPASAGTQSAAVPATPALAAPGSSSTPALAEATAEPAARAGAPPPDGGAGPGALRGLLGVGVALACACALFLLPALPSLLRLVAAKHQAQAVPAATWWGVLRLQAGTGQTVPAVLFWLVAVGGAVSLLRRRPRLGWYLLVLAAAQPAGILVLSPLGLARLQVLDRYLLPALPIVLLFVAAGLVCPWWPRQSAAGRRGQRLAAGGLLLVWLAAGPFADADFRASSFMHHNDLVAFALPRATLPPGGLPRPYGALGGPPGSAIVELPWPPVWDFGRSFYVYQEIHGLRVLVAPPAGALPADRRLRLRNRAGAEPASLLASGALWVVVHRHLGVEEDRLVLPPGAPPPRRLPPALAAQLAAEGERMIARLAAAWGPPAAADADVAVWSLRRPRRTL